MIGFESVRLVVDRNRLYSIVLDRIGLTHWAAWIRAVHWIELFGFGLIRLVSGWVGGALCWDPLSGPLFL